MNPVDSLPAPSPTVSRQAMHDLVHAFYAAVRADPELGPVFEAELHDRWDAHLARMVDFWCAATKVARGFRGDVYHKHMALPHMKPLHLQRWLRLWRAQTQALFAPEAAAELQATAIGVARVLHLGWFGHLPSPGALQTWLDSDTHAACTG